MRSGIFETRPEQTLVLLLDLKTEGQELLPYVLSHIQPLRKNGYLGYWNGTQVLPGAVTIVLTGKVSHDLLDQYTGYRHVFLDTPLDQLWEPDSINMAATVHQKATTGPQLWNSSTSFYASTSFKKAVGSPLLSHISSKQLSILRGQIRGAKERGLKVRYWETPAWPASLRNCIWQVLLDEGADNLSVDDLYATAFLDWTKVIHDWVNGRGWVYRNERLRATSIHRRRPKYCTASRSRVYQTNAFRFP